MKVQGWIPGSWRSFVAMCCFVLFSVACATDKEAADVASGAADAPRPMVGEGDAQAQPVEQEVDGMIRRYVANSEEQCAAIRFRCEPGEAYFADKKGCGCERPAGLNPPAEVKGEAGGLTRTSCMAGDRTTNCAGKEAHAVCGWFDPAKIQCIKAPCAGTYESSCLACVDEKVLEWTDGPCPQ